MIARPGRVERSNERPRPAARWRVWVVVALIGAGFFGVLWKSARLQIGLGDDLRALAEEQYLRKVPVSAPRGTIYDKDGRTLAVSVPAWSVFAEPRNIVDVEVTAQRLAEALGVPAAPLAQKLAADRAFLWIERRVPPDVAERVRALDLPGVGLRKEWRRTWPNKHLASQILGGVDIDGAGRGGVEQALDDRLAGRSTRLNAIADNKGDRVAVVDGAEAIFDLAVLAGDDVTLTIDLPLQQAASEILERTRAAFDARAAWAIVLDARTGAIRAVAQAPAFNPNTGEGDRRNHAFADAVEPGSIFKIATFAAALDAGVLGENDLIDCENGRYPLGRHVIHDTHEAGVISARQVFAQSSNIGTLKIAQRLGEERFRAALARFGFGARPGTGLLDETKGRLPQQERWGETRLATVSFGHGVLVSSLQVASFVQAVANGGVRHAPWLVERVEAADGGIVEQHQLGDGERILSEQSARTLLSMMEAVVAEGGTGTLAAIPGVRVGGKTGTAEKVDPVTGRYSRDLHLSSFVGVAPIDDPRIVAIVVVDEPKGVHFGGQTAGPAWREIVERALLAEGRIGVGSLAAVPTIAGVKERAAATAPPPPAIVEIAEPTTTTTASTGTPDLRGLSARAAVRTAAAVGREVTLQGSGVVVAQDPAPGGDGTGPIRLTLAFENAGAGMGGAR